MDRPIKFKFPVPFGPFGGPNSLSPTDRGQVRVSTQYLESWTTGNPSQVQARFSTQYLETWTTGDPTSMNVRLTQMYGEVVTSGDPTAENVRLTQMYAEVVGGLPVVLRSFGTVVG